MAPAFHTTASVPRSSVLEVREHLPGLFRTHALVEEDQELVLRVRVEGLGFRVEG